MFDLFSWLVSAVLVVEAVISVALAAYARASGLKKQAWKLLGMGFALIAMAVLINLMR